MQKNLFPLDAYLLRIWKNIKVIDLICLAGKSRIRKSIKNLYRFLFSISKDRRKVGAMIGAICRSRCLHEKQSKKQKEIHAA